MTLTDVSIRTAKPQEKPYRLFDTGGLYLEVPPTGRKWWRIKFRVLGKEKRLSLGVYPDVGLKDARERRDQIRKQVAAGIDPGENRKATKAAKMGRVSNTFEVVAREWLLKQSGLNPGYHDRLRRRFEADIFPYVGEIPVAEITPTDLLGAVRRIDDRGASESAHRALATCSQVMRYAVATGRAQRDPTVDLKGALPPVKGSHFPAITEPHKVGELLRILDGYDGTPIVRAALRLQPLVFVRPGELRHMEWTHIDFDTCEWRFLVTKTNTQHIVPLATQAIAILRELQPITGTGRYVFPALGQTLGQ